MRIEVPLTASLTRELSDFWNEIYGSPPDVSSEVLLGNELKHNTLYVTRRGERLAGTCLLTTSRTVPILAGVGEVATYPEFRGSGIATELCGQAVNDFRVSGGQAIFLGTVNPFAARVYYRLG